MSLGDLVQLCPPPASPVDPFCESRLEVIRERYGLILPQEYIDLAQKYGTGGFVGENTHEIFINNPFSRHYHEEVAYGQEVASVFFRDEEAQRQLAKNRLDQKMLFPLGRDTDRAFLYWVISQEPDKWRVLLIQGEWENWLEVLDCGLCSFLTGYFTSRLTVRTWQHRAIEGRPPRYHFESP